MLLVKKLMPIIIVLGLISITLTLIFNLENQLTYEMTINGIKLYVFDLDKYIQNLNNAWDTLSLDFFTIIPDATFKTANGNMLTADYWNTMFDNFKVIFNWMYMPINFVMYIWRWIAFFIQIALTLMGWPIIMKGGEVEGWIQNTPVYTSVLQTILTWIKWNLVIPYL